MLSFYVNDTKQLLQDTFGSFYSATQMVRWVNEARRILAMRTGCVRRLVTGQAAFGASAQPGQIVVGGMQPGGLPPTTVGSQGGSGGDFNNDFNNDFSGGNSGSSLSGAATTLPLQTIPRVERYPYAGFFNPVLRAQHAGCDKIIDSIDLAVSWGTMRPSLIYKPWDEFQACCRSYAVLNLSYPVVWSVANDGTRGEIWLFPTPSIAAEMELDCFVTPSPLYTDDNYDVIPEEYRDSVKYLVAGLIYLSTKRYADAQVMEALFAGSLGVPTVAVDRGKPYSYYWSGP